MKPEESQPLLEDITGIPHTWTHPACRRMGDLAESCLEQFLEWCPTVPTASEAWGYKRAGRDTACDNSYTFRRNCSLASGTTGGEKRKWLHQQGNGLLTQTFLPEDQPFCCRSQTSPNRSISGQHSRAQDTLWWPWKGFVFQSCQVWEWYQLRGGPAPSKQSFITVCLFLSICTILQRLSLSSWSQVILLPQRPRTSIPKYSYYWRGTSCCIYGSRVLHLTQARLGL